MLWAEFPLCRRAPSCHSGRQQGMLTKEIQNDQGPVFVGPGVTSVPAAYGVSPRGSCPPAATLLGHSYSCVLPAQGCHFYFSLCPKCSNPQGSFPHLIQFSDRSSLFREAFPDHLKRALFLPLVCFTFPLSTHFHLKHKFIC